MSGSQYFVDIDLIQITKMLLSSVVNSATARQFREKIIKILRVQQNRIAFVTTISLHLRIRQRGETAKKWHTKFKIKMTQLIVQIYKLSRAASRTARRCDILALFVARCTLVKGGAVQSG